MAKKMSVDNEGVISILPLPMVYTRLYLDK